MRASNYDKFPRIEVPGHGEPCLTGWDQVIEKLSGQSGSLLIECYPGVDSERIISELSKRLPGATIIDTSTLLLSPEEVEVLVSPFLGGDDPVFGFLCGLDLPQFFHPAKVLAAKQRLKAGAAIVVGVGATLLSDEGILIYADLPRWEAQLRFRRNESENLGAHNREEKWSLQYKRAFFVDWRVADRWKRPLIPKWDYVLDSTDNERPLIVSGAAVRAGFDQCLKQPFRVVPFFDPAPWGGQWMKEVCGLDPTPANYGWCFDCVPEENSLLLSFGETVVELPAIDLVFYNPRALLGDKVYSRFGDEFPIRFDFLDTIGGGNLSFQVHPTTEYIQGHFGMHYTQDESYYLLDAEPGASVYLGTKTGVDSKEMIAALENAQAGGSPFEAERYANKWPAKKHDHFLIPAGTVHCSGAGAMVLEISATPYIFTFKLWDWNRLGLDGKPRPIYLEHGKRVINWERETDFTSRELINPIIPLVHSEGWREESTGLHAMEFIETRRHWFTAEVPHHTQGGVNVLNLVEGEAAVVESPDGAFEPFDVHYAETFIVPAAVGSYTIRPLASSAQKELATLKAFVRT